MPFKEGSTGTNDPRSQFCRLCVLFSGCWILPPLLITIHCFDSIENIVNYYLVQPDKKQFWRCHLYCLGAVVNFLFADFLHRNSHIWMIYSTISNPEMMDIPSHRLIWLPILDNKSDVCKNICNSAWDPFRTKKLLSLTVLELSEFVEVVA